MKKKVAVLICAVGMSLSLVALPFVAAVDAADIKPVKLKLQDYSSPSGARVESIKWWMAEITKRSGGKITFETYWAQSLVPAKEALEAVSTKLADVGMISSAYFTGQLPLHNLGNIPLGAASFEASAYAFNDLYDLFPELQAELKKQGVMVLYTQGTPPMQLHFSRKPVHKLEDMKGLKVRSYGLSSEVLSSWGAVPVAMPFPEIYEALKMGTIDGTVSYLYTQKPYRHYEVAKYFLLGNFGALPCQPFIINLKTWESLGPEGQKVVKEVSVEAQKVLIDYFNKEDKECLQIMKDAGVDIYVMPADQRARWVEKGRGVWDKWAKEMDGKGLPGTKISKRFLELAEKYEQKRN